MRCITGGLQGDGSQVETLMPGASDAGSGPEANEKGPGWVQRRNHASQLSGKVAG